MSNIKRPIQVQGLWKVFGDHPERATELPYSAKTRKDIQEELGLVVALREVTFNVEPGEVFVVMGLSGSGKSTLVRCLSRLIEPTMGQVHFYGENVLTYEQEDLIQFRRQKIAMVFQSYGLLPHRRVLDNVAFGLEVQGMDEEMRYQEAAEAIRIVGLSGWEEYFPREMSGGMQQRVGLARALALNSDVLLMDEPFSGLDPLIRREMQDLLIDLQSELNKTIVFITHDLDEALKIGDRIAIMRDGEIVQMGLPEEIVTRPEGDYVSEFVQDVSLAKVIKAKAIMKEPTLVFTEGRGSQSPLQAMKEKDSDWLFLLSQDGMLKGVVDRTDTASLSSEPMAGSPSLSVGRALTISPEDSIDDIVPKAALTEIPLPVVNVQGKLLGEVSRTTLLSGLVSGNGEDGQAGSLQDEMTTGPERLKPEVATPIVQSSTESDMKRGHSNSGRFSGLRPYLFGAVALIVTLAICLIFWQPGMPFPAEWGRGIGVRVDEWVLWLTINGSWFFDGIKGAITRVLVAIEDLLLWIPWPVVILGVALTAWKLSGRNMAFFAALSLLLLGLMGRLPGGTSTLWEGTMETMALIVVSVTISLLIGIPVGIIGSRNALWNAVMRPILDGMQTMPSFVYLVPGILFFGLGNVPAIMATVIYAVPPVIRLTNLGIRQVSSEVVEAARSFGSTPLQLLTKVQIPLALPTIMAGINQTTMAALAMVVVASLVGAGGLGEAVLRALGRQEAGNSAIAGLSIVVMAIIIDRITQAAARERQEVLMGTEG